MYGMQANSEWSHSIANRLARGIESARGKRSDQWIADQTAELGYPLSRPAISEYRRGKRKTMSVTDLLVIAAALDVPPVALLFPDLPDGKMDLLPAVSDVTSLDAMLWFTGERETLPGKGDDFLPKAYTRRQEYEWQGLEYHLSPETVQSCLRVSLSRKLAAAFSEFADLHKPDVVTDFLEPGEALDRHLQQRDARIQQVVEEIKKLQTELLHLGGIVDSDDSDGQG